MSTGSFKSNTPLRKPRKKTFLERLFDFLVSVGLLALAGGAGYWHAWKTGALILIVAAYFQRLRRRWDIEGGPTLFERLYGFYKEIRAELDARNGVRPNDTL